MIGKLNFKMFRLEGVLDEGTKFKLLETALTLTVHFQWTTSKEFSQNDFERNDLNGPFKRGALKGDHKFPVKMQIDRSHNVRIHSGIRIIYASDH